MQLKVCVFDSTSIGWSYSMYHWASEVTRTGTDNLTCMRNISIYFGTPYISVHVLMKINYMQYAAAAVNSYSSLLYDWYQCTVGICLSLYLHWKINAEDILSLFVKQTLSFTANFLICEIFFHKSFDFSSKLDLLIKLNKVQQGNQKAYRLRDRYKLWGKRIFVN